MDSKAIIDSVSGLYSDEIIRGALLQLNNRFDDASLIETCFAIENGDILVNRKLIAILDEIKEEYRQRIKELTRLCKCTEIANVLVLPCGHLNCCSKCITAVGMRRCYTCNKVIRASKEVHYC